jgi:hypothetical protein
MPAGSEAPPPPHENKPPLTVRHSGRSAPRRDASPTVLCRCHELRHGRRTTAVRRCGCFQRWAALPGGRVGARSRGGDKDSDPRLPDGRPMDRLHRKRRMTTSRSSTDRADGGRRAPRGNRRAAQPNGCRRQAHRSWVWPDLATAASRRSAEERKDAKVRAHATERGEFRFWDHWLTDARAAVFVCDVATGRCRGARRHRSRAATVNRRPDDYDIAPTAAKSRSPRTSLPSRR